MLKFLGLKSLASDTFVVCEQFKGEPYVNLPLDIGGYVELNQFATKSISDNHESINREKEDKSEDEVVSTYTLDPSVVRFVACGDLSGWGNNGGVQVLDSDKSYPMGGGNGDGGGNAAANYIPPIAPPIEPPYQTSISMQKESRRERQQQQQQR